MAYYIDYKGMIDPTRSGAEHVGILAITGPGAKRILMLRPGLQQVKSDLWEAIREVREIGFDKKTGTCNGHLVAGGYLTVYETKGDKMDWQSVVPQLDDLSRRTTVVSVLNDMLAFAETVPRLSFLCKRLREQIEKCSTDFDDKPVPAERLVPVQEVA